MKFIHTFLFFLSIEQLESRNKDKIVFDAQRMKYSMN